MAPEVGYWNLRGYGQPIRLLLAHSGTEFVEKRFNMSLKKDNDSDLSEWSSGYDLSEWYNVKFSFGLDFPNCPYYIDGDVKLSQSFAIMKYLGRKHNLVPKTEEEKIRVDLIEGEALDMRFNWSTLCYSAQEEFEKKKPEFLTKLSTKLKEISDFLGAHEWFAGKTMTYMDFIMYEILYGHSTLEPKALEDFKNLQAFLERFRALESISAYMKSDKFIAYPINGPMAAFGGK